MPSLGATPGARGAPGSQAANRETGSPGVAVRVAVRVAVPAKAAARLAVGWVGAARAMVGGVMGSAAVTGSAAVGRAVTGSAGAGAAAARVGTCPAHRPQHWRSWLTS